MREVTWLGYVGLHLLALAILSGVPQLIGERWGWPIAVGLALAIGKDIGRIRVTDNRKEPVDA